MVGYTWPVNAKFQVVNKKQLTVSSKEHGAMGLWVREEEFFIHFILLFAFIFFLPSPCMV